MSPQTMQDKQNIAAVRFPAAQEMRACIRGDQFLSGYSDIRCSLHLAPVSRSPRLIAHVISLLLDLSKLSMMTHDGCKDHPIGIHLTQRSVSRVGAGAAWMRGWGPCGRPPFPCS